MAPWWRHQMEAFSALLALCVGNSPVTREFPHKGQWSGALMFSLICAWMNGWVNNREAGDLRRHLAHYHVTVMHCNVLKNLISVTDQHFFWHSIYIDVNVWQHNVEVVILETFHMPTGKFRKPLPSGVMWLFGDVLVKPIGISLTKFSIVYWGQNKNVI